MQFILDLLLQKVQIFLSSFYKVKWAEVTSFIIKWKNFKILWSVSSGQLRSNAPRLIFKNDNDFFIFDQVEVRFQGIVASFCSKSLIRYAGYFKRKTVLKCFHENNESFRNWKLIVYEIILKIFLFFTFHYSSFYKNVRLFFQ